MNIKIMIADDDDDDINILKDVLEDIFNDKSLSFTLQLAKNGVEVMSMLENEQELPKILFLDINMPFKNGFACLEEMKANDRYKNILVVMLSTSTYHSDIRKAYESGAALYIPKATDYVNFKLKIANCLAKFEIGTIPA